MRGASPGDRAVEAPPPVRRRRLDEGLWVAEHPLSTYGLELGRRMTVVRLSDGGLWLHSVARLTPQLRGWLRGLGPVRFVVSPSKLHHYWMEEYAEAYPDAELWASPGLAEKRDDLEFAGVLGEEPAPGWEGDLRQTLFRGNAILAEVEFLHPSTRTLILNDVCFNLPADAPPLTRLAARLLGVHRTFGVPRDVRWTTRDREAARASVDRILAWDFDRVIVAHGEIVETDGRAAVERAFAWLRRG